VNVVVCVAIGLDRGFPGRRFGVAGAIIADQPLHRGESARNWLGNLGVALGIRGLEYERRDLPAQQSARLVANRPRGREIEATEIVKREIAALEGAGAIEHRVRAGLVGCIEKRHPRPKRGIVRKPGKVRGRFLTRGGNLLHGAVAHLLQGQY
jgi:hypothetical protein